MKNNCDNRGIFHNYTHFDDYGDTVVGYCERCKDKKIAKKGTIDEDELHLRNFIQLGSKWFWFERGKCDQTSNEKLKQYIPQHDWLVPEMGVRDGAMREEMQHLKEDLEVEIYL